MTTMRATVLTAFGGPEVLEMRDVPVPAPGAGQVLVRVTAAALNNTDVWTRTGAYGLPGRPDAPAGWRGPVAFPRIQGGDAAGEVAAVGPGVDPAWHGRRVLVDPALYDGPGPHAHPVGLLGSEADGAFAEYVVVGADRVHDVTGSPLTDDELACLPVAYGTAAGMLDRGRVTDGESVLVTGASGGVGLGLVQLAAARGARVLALTGRARDAAVRAAGADDVVHREDGPAAVADAARRFAPGGLDAVADVAGGELLAAVLPELREGGRWVIAGAVAGPVVELDLRRLYLHNRTIVGSSMHTPAQFDRLVDDARAGHLAPRVAARYDLADLPAAQERFRRGEDVGKIVVHPGR